MMFKLKLKLLVFVSITMIKCVNAQLNEGYIKNYSYHVVGVIENKAEIVGTGFFIKKGLKYYFVSAWHCFSFKNHITKNYRNPKAPLIKDIVIYRNLSDIRTNDYLRIKLVDSITTQPIYLSIFQNEKLLDISAIEIKWEPSFKFDFYEIDTQSNLMQAIGDKAFYYGFPIINGKQSDLSVYFEGTITEINSELNESTIKITGYIGCSGAPLFIVKDDRVILKGVLFYALKDTTGKANLCKAIDIKCLLNNLY